MTDAALLATNENDKKRHYNRRILDVEHGAFTPLVFSTTGGMGPECERFHKEVAKRLSEKRSEPYSQTMSYIRSRISFSLLRSALMCLRGSRKWTQIPTSLASSTDGTGNLILPPLPAIGIATHESRAPPASRSMRMTD